MAKTFATLKKAICAYMTRDEPAFVREGFNSLNQAINDAHTWMQRTHVFERASVEITVPDVSLTAGADLSTAVLRGTSTSVQVRSLKTAWIPNSDGTGEFPVDIIDRKVWVARQKRRYDTALNNAVTQAPTSGSEYYPLEIVLNGTLVHFSSANPSVISGAAACDVHFDAVKWFPDYEEDEDTDFFLDFCFDFMVMKSVENLSTYLKEDQRVVVPNKQKEDAWLSIIRWDTSLAFLGTSASTL